ncbi:hypothetical protein P1J78_04790 [Psychromarinibacter sp. C21-152]|uniref:Uncharacterized protein n=1 Tax=Psychromarinibacter sediminicola TaxID=3033385 RepID=A0AAE3NQ67_9RHOB|nr:hypothetical protein [Psychromarinibacter sediminicola]MDF0600042.1 hypothetical protein [Psychromarinibacter sediminicola]
MAEKPKTSEDQQPEPTVRAWPMPFHNQRRLYRPEDTPEAKRTVFTDWASI